MRRLSYMRGFRTLSESLKSALLRRRITGRAGALIRPRPARTPLPSSAFAGFRFPPEAITVAVRWWPRYGLSYRDLEMEQVAGEDRVSLGPEKLGPGRPATLWRGVDCGCVEDLPDGGGADLVAEAGESPWIRRYPHVGFSVDRRTARVRNPEGMGGRPARRWLGVLQRRAMSRRCQRGIVAGVTSRPIRRGRGNRRIRRR